METELHRSRAWLLVTLALVFLLAGYLAVRWFFPPAPPLRPVAPEQFPVAPIAPVISPPLNSIKDLEPYVNNKPLPAAPSAKVYQRPETRQEGHLRGDPNAPVSIIEYTDLTGDGGRLIHPVLIDLLAQNGGRVNWMFRHYVAKDNALDLTSAQAVECMGQQLGEDTVWQYLDLLFRQKSITESLLYSLASEKGADATALRTCVTGRTFRDRVMLSKFYAQSDLKVFIIPSFVFVNNVTKAMRVVEGINTRAYMQAVLDDLTKEPEPPPEEELVY